MESGAGMMAAIRINNKHTAKGNLGLLLTSWWDKNLDADMHNNAEWDKFFIHEERGKSSWSPFLMKMTITLFHLISLVLTDLWPNTSRHWKSGWLSLACSIWPTCHAQITRRTIRMFAHPNTQNHVTKHYVDFAVEVYSSVQQLASQSQTLVDNSTLSCAEVTAVTNVWAFSS